MKGKRTFSKGQRFIENEFKEWQSSRGSTRKLNFETAPSDLRLQTRPTPECALAGDFAQTDHGLTKRKYRAPPAGQLVTLSRPLVVLTPWLQYAPSVFV